MTGPYGEAAPVYRAAGWRGVLPLPPRLKHPPPEGYTGHRGRWPTDEEVAHWVATQPDGNVCLRPPEDVLGVDVDAYDGKAGAATMEQADLYVDDQLPPTWVSTARNDGVSGIRWFRVPTGVTWRSDLGHGSGVEVVRYGHRFAVVGPSVHPDTGTTYRWERPDGTVATEPPSPDDLPEMPAAWVALLTRSREPHRETPNGTATTTTTTTVTSGTGLSHLTSWTDLTRHFVAQVEAGAPRNETGMRLALQLRDNRCPIGDALETYLPMFVQLLGDLATRPGGDGEPYTVDEARVTVRSIYRHGAPRDQLPAFGVDDHPAPAPGMTTASAVSDATSVSPALETTTDLGNTRRLIRLHGAVLRYVEDEDAWLRRDGTRWRRVTEHEVVGLTTDVVDDIRADALAAEPGSDERNALVRWAVSSESYAQRRATVAGARSERAIALRAVDLDRDHRLLATPTQVLDLGDEAREVDPDEVACRDVLTRVTNVPYDPAATSPLLDEFLTTFMPDPAHSRYLWKVLGYSLLGGNTFRILVIMIGGTTSGKSQLIEAVAATLGEYAVPVGTSVFRGNQDDRPRPDILRAMPARLVYAEEASSAWELHTDQVKRMTGGTEVGARAMRSNVMVERVPAFTPLIVTNEMPRLRGADQAVRRRLLVLRFGHSLAPGEEDVRKKVAFVADPATRMAVLARLVEGCLRAQAEGLADIPADFGLATMEAWEQLNHVVDFVGWLTETGQLVDGDPLTTPLSHCWKHATLHDFYVDWIRRHGDAEDVRTRLNARAFGQALRQLGWETQKSAGARWVGKLQRMGSE